jgi:UDP-N-acetylmuramoyl-L-alanyl-D-glutamate--2,6-diaminopimelate ligase
VRLDDLLGDVDVLELVGDARVEVCDIAIDHRLVRPGALFACVPGHRADGHDFAAAAAAAGATALLVERGVAVPLPQVRVRSVRAALGPVAAACFGHPSRSLQVVGVTGTNGKTTVTWFVEAVARAAGRRTGRIGTTGAVLDGTEVPAPLTTPEAPDVQRLLARGRAQGVEVVAMEVSSHALATGRVEGTRFAAVAFTNLGSDHLDFHGDAARYREAKARLFRRAHSGRAACCVDDPQGEWFARRATDEGLTTVRYGLSAGAEVRAEGLEPTAEGWTFDLVLAGGRAGRVALPRVGRHDVRNALGAAALAELIGIEAPAIVAGLERVPAPPGRMEPIAAGQPFAVYVDYAHTPDALAAVLAAARERSRGRVILVFGCGGDRDAGKRPEMGRVAATADLVVLTSDNPRSEDPAAIADAVEAGLTAAGRRARRILDRAAAIGAALEAAGPGDVVVVAGKGHEATQEVGGRHLPFDDRQVVRDILGAQGWS